MNINRSNYETILLQYVDQELSAAEQKAVDAFLAANPDLLPELTALQEAVLMPEPVTLFDKKQLLKPVVSAELEAQLLMLVDGELEAREQSSLLATIEKDPIAAQLLHEFEQTRLSPETTIQFPDKAVLYRYEKDRVIPIWFRRVAVAALLIGAGTFGAMQLINNGSAGSSSTSFASADTGKTTHPAKLESGSDNNSPQPSTTASPSASDNSEMAQVNVSGSQEDNIDNTTPTPTRNMIVAPTNIAPATINPDNPSIASSENINNQPRNILPTNSVSSTGNPTATTAVNNESGNATTFTQPANEYASNATFTDDNQQQGFGFTEDDDRKKKTKLTAFLRKAKRVLQRNTGGGSNEDNKLKVANMEFAVH